MMNMEAVAKQQMQQTRRKILELLKHRGPLTADELSEMLSITSMGIRQHLKALEHDDLIEHEAQQQPMGRPRHVHRLTPLGDELFPRAYAQMATSLLGAVRALDGEVGIDRIFKQRTDHLLAQYKKRLIGKSLEERVAELAKIRTEEGYMADWVRLSDGSLALREHNCSICQVASECPQACSFELKLFQRALPDVKVTRDEHMIKGDRMCTYLIRTATKR